MIPNFVEFMTTAAECYFVVVVSWGDGVLESGERVCFVVRGKNVLVSESLIGVEC